jgi:hypothetical protein
MLSNYLENELLDHVLRVGAYPQPSGLYVALGTGASDAGLTGEPTGVGSYARVLHNTWASPASRASSNTGAVTFPMASAAWGTMTHFGIFDALSGGNLLIWGALTTPKAVASGNTPSFATGVLIPTFNAGAFSTYLANALLGHVLRVAAYTPTALNLALSTANPGDTGSGIAEPSGNNYARRSVSSSFGAASNGSSANNALITFNVPSGSWGLITHMAIYDQTTNMLIYTTATPNQTPASGDTVQYAIGALTVTLD